MLGLELGLRFRDRLKVRVRVRVRVIARVIAIDTKQPVCIHNDRSSICWSKRRFISHPNAQHYSKW